MKQSLDVKLNLFINKIVVLVEAHDANCNLAAFLTCACPMGHLQGATSISLSG
jgi:hypothetical protein